MTDYDTRVRTLTSAGEELLAKTCAYSWDLALERVHHGASLSDADCCKHATWELVQGTCPTIACDFDDASGKAFPLPVDLERDDDGRPVLASLEWLRRQQVVTFHTANLDKFEKRFGLASGMGILRFLAACPNIEDVKYIGHGPGVAA